MQTLCTLYERHTYLTLSDAHLKQDSKTLSLQDTADAWEILSKNKLYFYCSFTYSFLLTLYYIV